ncbi:uncharacterized protein LOC115748021 [Rhodamnia argentea]|uniref:Uncharacterized protein LOC115748021 n=1 Tax=Rhodamnia argentea TaxID=178133 RepID=A0A8B8Q1H5_9MYRT|nr:uncharacterized protein LOC115748021 [Rhodamnia argentea]
MEAQLLLQSLALPISPASSRPSSPRRGASLKTAFRGRHAHARRVPRTLVAKCSVSEGEQSGDSKDALSGVVGVRVEELLSREENRGLLDGLERASRRVDEARRELAEIERQEVEARRMRNYIEQLESRASEIAESQRELSEARALVEEAERSLSRTAKARDEERDGAQINREEERWESVKAASVSALVGTLAGLPLSLAQVAAVSQLVLPSGIDFISCALFGITFRYAVRRDLDNIQLKTGTSAAFGFVRGLACLGAGPPLELNLESFLSHAFSGAVYIAEGLLIFVFAAVALEFCFKMRVLSPFPIERPESRTG